VGPPRRAAAVASANASPRPWAQRAAAAHCAAAAAAAAAAAVATEGAATVASAAVAPMKPAARPERDNRRTTS